jgi:hypothetical protein
MNTETLNRNKTKKRRGFMSELKRLVRLLWQFLGTPGAWLLMMIAIVFTQPFDSPIRNDFWVFFTCTMVFMTLILEQLKKNSTKKEIETMNKNIEQLAACVKKDHHGHGDRTSISVKHWND